jgi:nicotinate dehydrogenase subunit B
MHRKDEDYALLARRDFLKATGALVVGFRVAENAADAQGARPSMIRGLTSGPPDEAEIDSFLAVHPNNTVTIYTGYVELGQGGPTALRQVAAEELDLDLEQILSVRMDTFVSTNGFTAASRTAGIGGKQMRVAAAEARRALLNLAADRLQAPAAELMVSKGVVSVKNSPNRSTTYGDLLGDKPFNHRYEPFSYTGGLELPRKGTDHAVPKSPMEYKIVGTKAPRPDIAEKAAGTYTYMQHVRVPGMLHARLILPQGQGALGVSLPTVLAVDEASIRDIPGVQIVRRRNLVAVVAPREWDAVRAARQLKVMWQEFSPTLPGTDGIHEKYRGAQSTELSIHDSGDFTAAISKAVHTVSASYASPYQSHGTMAPNCAIADVKPDSALVMCSDQGVYQVRPGLAQVLGLSVDKIRVQYYAGSNTYGSSCYREATEAAAIISQEIGKPVRLQLTRQDEFGWDNYGPAHLADLRGGVDENGKIVAFEYQAWGHGQTAGEAVQHLALGTVPKESAAAAVGGLYQIRLSQNDMYDVPHRRLIQHRVPAAGYFRIGPLRAPLDPAYFFAQESMIDELAYAAKIDPYEFRKLNISHPRWLGVLKAATDAARWTPRVAASKISREKIGHGRGIGLGTHHLAMNQGNRITYAAAVVEVEVNKDTGVVLAKHIYGAMDCGLALNPGIVESQIVGMSNHGASLALKEEIQFNSNNVTSLDWNSYHTLRFAEHPAVTPIVVQQLNEPSSGAGEEVLPAVVAAIGNAFFDATGVRLRRCPLTPTRVLDALRSNRTNTASRLEHQPFDNLSNNGHPA